MCNFSHFQLHILIFFFLVFCFPGVAEILHPLHLFPNPSMARTCGGHSFRPQRPSSPPPAAEQSNPPTAAPATSPSTAPVHTTPAPRKYDTRVGPTLPSLTHPRLSRRAQTSYPGESSSSRPYEPHSPPVQGLADDLPPDLSPTSIIRQPFFHCGPIIGNSDCSTMEVHCETYYDLPAFAVDPELRDSMRLMYGYSLEPFMTPCRFFYPRVVIEFYHTMTSRRVPHPTVIHFSIDSREGTLQVVDIPVAFHFPDALSNSADYRL